MNSLIKVIRYSSLLVIAMILVACSENASSGNQVFISDGYSNKIVDGYWIYLPRNYRKDKPWPVILFLQGSNGASPYPRTSKEDGPVKYALKNVMKGGEQTLVSDTFIIINPHMRTGPIEKRQWYQYPRTLNEILNEVVNKYSGDSNRIYLTGLSAGGHGSWGLAKKYPEKFAAIVPIAGRINCKNGCEKLSDISIWIIHNIEDRNVEFDYSLNAVAYMEKELQKTFLRTSQVELTPDQINSNRIFSMLKTEGHDAWSATYSSTSLYHWLLTKRINKADNK